MTKMLKLVCLSLLALTVVGCGKKAIVPEKTIVAAYIDVKKAYDNGKDFANTIIDAVPADAKAEAERGYEGFKVFGKIKDALKVEWAVIAFGGDMKNLADDPEKNLAFALKVKASEDDAKKLMRDLGADMDKIKTEKKDGHLVIERGARRWGLIDEKYLVFSESKNAFEDMFDLYAGKGKRSDDFGDLSKISGDTVCRVSTAPISSLIKRFELTKEVEKFGEACEDKELAEMILNMGAISLDVGVGDKLAFALRVAFGSSDDAKIVANLMGSAAFLARVGCDAVAYIIKNPERFGAMDVPRDAQSSIADYFIHLAKNIKAERDGNTAMFSIALEVKKAVKLIEKGVLSPNTSTSYFTEVRITTTRSLIKNIEDACMSYNLKHGGKYPSQLSDLLEGDDDNPPLLDCDLEDPWGNEIKYERRGKKRPLLTSAGPDSEFGTEDDITNLDKKK